MRPERLRIFAFLISTLIGFPEVHHLARAEGKLMNFVPPGENAKACWAATFDGEQPSRQESQNVASMFLALQYRREKVPQDSQPRKLLFYSLDVTFLDGRKGTALGNCLPGEGEAISCAVECDGGGVDLILEADKALTVTLKRTGMIKLRFCGGDADTLTLQEKVHGSSYMLSALPSARCPEVVLPDPNAGVD